MKEKVQLEKVSLKIMAGGHSVDNQLHSGIWKQCNASESDLASNPPIGEYGKKR